MPLRPAPTARSSSRSSKRSDPILPVGEIVAAHALRGLVRVRAYQPGSPSLGAGRHVLLDRAGSLSEAEGGERERLIPVIADVVRAIDRDARRIVIEPMPGLLD